MTAPGTLPPRPGPADHLPAATDPEVLRRLTEALGDKVRTDPASLAAARTDESGHATDAAPLAVVEAQEIEDVQAVCRICTATGTPIVTRGAGTGLAGGAIGGAGEVVLSTARMDRILEISPQNRLAVVQPGILNGTLNAALAEQGLWWPPDPASKDISSVGGNIATNAGGLLCAKYGVTRESVLALKVVLADGTLISVGHRTVKGVTGLDLCALMIGSEGVLGVIVECTLKLRPAVTGPVPTIAAFFEDVEAAAAACSAVTAAHLEPAVMELLDEQILAAVSAHTGVDLIDRGRSYVLIQTDGPGAEATAQAIRAVLEANGGRVEFARDPAEAARLVQVRREVHPAMTRLGTALIEDVAVPRDRLAAMYARIADIADRYDVAIPTNAHAGDGNLHPTFVFAGTEVPPRVWDAADELFQYAIELGGTLTGEHGVGVLKRRWLGDELGTDQLALQRRIKAAFDPDGLLNPGKVFAP
ncbi:FAD-linked oxidase [Tersicoccus solisilvae]|uniref:FAD-linked oxidase n=1 Tax=Tersicoccus solisilvae TaxID=1882339 RepID=A0ABQ1P8G9_9MICC|nr:FAD-linked oxidase C-terminal domain-containing protein [Tersicoccus solisilvae]GGC93160.1 FAD-linked oxidase [Tersicoccus solisilvae]